VTRFIDINSTEISPPLGDSDWLIDSAANAYTTPFKSDLLFFIEANIGQVKGFSGKLTTALGKGSMTLTDIAGNRLTLHDVCYVPESQDQILSLMEFRREYHAKFWFTGLDTFVMKAANGFEFSGKAINDILHASLSRQPEVNVAATRFTDMASRRGGFGSSSKPSRRGLLRSHPRLDGFEDDPNPPSPRQIFGDPCLASKG